MAYITSTGALRKASQPPPPRAQLAAPPPVARQVITVAGVTGPVVVTRPAAAAPQPARRMTPIANPPVFRQGGQRAELGMTDAERDSVARGELDTGIAYVTSPVDRHRHRAASVKKLSGRDPMVVRRWIAELQRSNPDFMVVLDAVLEGNPNSDSHRAALLLSAETLLVSSPWGKLSLFEAARAAAQTMKSPPGPVLPSIKALLGPWR